jgi:SanA protein
VKGTVGEIVACEWALLLGTDNRDAIRRRREAILELFRAGKIQKAVISGSPDNGGVNEVEQMRKFVAAGGIPEASILLDERGTRTLRAVENLRAIVGNERVVIVTDNYHIHRAVFLASSVGLEAEGFAAEAHRISMMYVWCSVREIASRCRAVGDWVVIRVKDEKKI